MHPHQRGCHGQVNTTPEFDRCLTELQKAAKDGKAAYQKACTARDEAANDGEIKIVQPTREREDRIPGARKYDLGGGPAYRLVVQSIREGSEEVLWFVFVGTHEETERWLNNKRGTDWWADQQPRRQTKSKDAPDRQRRLLSFLKDEDWEALELSKEAKDYASRITDTHWDKQQDNIIKQIAWQSDGDEEIAEFMHGNLQNAREGRYETVRKRIQDRRAKKRVSVTRNPSIGTVKHGWLAPILWTRRCESRINRHSCVLGPAEALRSRPGDTALRTPQVSDPPTSCAAGRGCTRASIPSPAPAPPAGW